MRLEFWGARGTAPVSGRDKVVFGGNTPCASVRSAAGDLLIIDAGTGIRDLGEALLREAGEEGFRVHLLLTHFHLDHIIGLPFFRPLFSAKAAITFYSTGPREEAEKRLAGLMEGRYFPVTLRRRMPGKNSSRCRTPSPSAGPVSIAAHPSPGSVAYKLEGGRSLVFATDTEELETAWTRVVARRRRTCLVYDATFSPGSIWRETRFKQHLARGQGWPPRRGPLTCPTRNPGHSDRQIKG
jgi:phosphoribosyl 1,2-cyclic phosphodiesterase